MITSNASEVIRQLRAYKSLLKKKEGEIVTELVDVGTEIANDYLRRATVTGYPDAGITSEAKGKRGHISMVGYSAGFIEFGTGMHYIEAGQAHPLADEFGALRGEWGLKQGKNPPWSFFGDVGQNPLNTTVPIGKGFTLTYGFPANRTMYNTGKELHQRLEDIVKDVFND